MELKRVLEIINDRLGFLETVLKNSHILKGEYGKSRFTDNEIDGHIFRLEDEKSFLLWCKERLAEAQPKE